MSEFKYIAMTSDGKKIKGTYEAANAAEVTMALRQRNYFVSQVKQVGGGLNKDIELFGSGKIPIAVLARFCTQMAAMLRVGVPVFRTLEILKIEIEHKPLKKILADVFDSIQTGVSLSTAFKVYEKAFPVFFLSMIDAGEATGGLDNCLKRAGDSFTKTARIKSKVKSAMSYPTFMLFFMIGIFVLLLTWVLPQFATVYDAFDSELPIYTQFVLNLSDRFIENWLFFLIFVVVTVGGIVLYCKTDSGGTQFDLLKMRVPLVGKLTSKIYSSRFCRTLSSLTLAGVGLPEALEVTARSVGNRYFEKRIRSMVTNVSEGMNLSSAMEQIEVLPVLVVSVTKLGEESGTIEEMLSQVADYYDDEADTAIASMVSLMGPMMIVLLAVLVLPILIAAVLPMFGMVEAVMSEH